MSSAASWVSSADAAELEALLQTCGLSHLAQVLDEEELTVPLLRAMSDLHGALAEVGVAPRDAAVLHNALHCPPPLKRDARAGTTAYLLGKLGLERYLPLFEEEALSDVSLLASMGASLRANLEELGLDGAAVGVLTTALRDGSSSLDRSAASREAVPMISERAGPAAPLAVVYINLAKRSDRRASMEETLRGTAFDAVRVEAVSGEHAPKHDVCTTWDTTLNARFDRNCKAEPALPMSDGERGCAASHVQLWRRCVESNAPLVVLEDDIRFATPLVAQWTQALVGALSAAFSPDERTLVLYLGAEAEVKQGAPSLQGTQAIWAARAALAECVLKEAIWAWQTHAYVIWPAAARVLLASLPVDAPVDVFLSSHYHEHKLCGLVMQPNLASQLDPYRGGDVLHSSLVDRQKMFGVDRMVAAAGYRT